MKRNCNFPHLSLGKSSELAEATTVLKVVRCANASSVSSVQSCFGSLSDLYGFKRVVSMQRKGRNSIFYIAIRAFSVMSQKKEMYQDLIRALEVMRLIDEKTPKNIVFYAMWLLETRQLKNSVAIHVSLP